MKKCGKTFSELNIVQKRFWTWKSFGFCVLIFRKYELVPVEMSNSLASMLFMDVQTWRRLKLAAIKKRNTMGRHGK